MEVTNLMIEYKKATLKFIDEVKKDGQPEKYLEERENIIYKLKKINIDKELLKKVYDDLSIISLEEEAMSILKEEK